MGCAEIADNQRLLPLWKCLQAPGPSPSAHSLPALLYPRDRGNPQSAAAGQLPPLPQTEDVLSGTHPEIKVGPAHSGGTRPRKRVFPRSLTPSETRETQFRSCNRPRNDAKTQGFRSIATRTRCSRVLELASSWVMVSHGTLIIELSRCARHAPRSGGGPGRRQLARLKGESLPPKCHQHSNLSPRN